jgi:hypothetical protein
VVLPIEIVSKDTIDRLPRDTAVGGFHPILSLFHAKAARRPTADDKEVY